MNEEKEETTHPIIITPPSETEDGNEVVHLETVDIDNNSKEVSNDSGDNRVDENNNNNNETETENNAHTTIILPVSQDPEPSIEVQPKVEERGVLSDEFEQNEPTYNANNNNHNINHEDNIYLSSGNYNNDNNNNNNDNSNEVDIIEIKNKSEEEIAKIKQEKEKKKSEETRYSINDELLIKKQEAEPEENWTKPIVVSAVKDLEKALASDQYSLQITLARNLSRASTTENGKKELVNHISLLVRLLDGSPDVQQSSLEILNNIATIEVAKERFRQADGFTAIIKLFESVFEIRSIALNVLGYLITRNVENANAFYEKGGISGLVRMLNCENSRIKFFAAACIWVLAAYQSEKYQESMVEAGAVPVLLTLVRSPHEDIGWQAAGALRNLLTRNPAIHETIIAVKGVRQLKKVVDVDSNISDRILILIAQSLAIISSNDDIKVEMRKRGMIKALINRLELSDNSQEMNTRLLITLSNLCTKNPENQTQFMLDGGLALILRLIGSNETELEIKSLASTTLWAASLSNREVIEEINKKYFDALKQLLILEPENVLVGIIATISNFASISEEYQNVLRERGMIPLLVDFMRCTHIPILETTAAALLALMRDNNDNIKEVLDWDGALILSRNLFCTNGGVKQCVTGALRTIFPLKPDPVIKAIREVDGLKAIINMLKEADRVQLQINATYVLLFLAEHDLKFRVKMMEMKLELGIGVCMQQSKSPRLLCVCCDLISHLAAFDETFRRALGFEDVVKSVAEIIRRSNDPTLLDKSVRALWALNLNSLPHQQVTRVTGCLSRLIELFMDAASLPTPLPLSVKSQILKAIAAITSKNVKNQEEVRLYDGMVKRITESLILEEVEDMPENASLALWCLSVNNVKMQQTFRESNGFFGMLQIFNIGIEKQNERLLTNATGVLHLLVHRCQANKQIFKEAGILPILSNPALQTIATNNKNLQAQLKTLTADFN